jgi:hypothetical protein
VKNTSTGQDNQIAVWELDNCLLLYPVEEFRVDGVEKQDYTLLSGSAITAQVV